MTEKQRKAYVIGRLKQVTSDLRGLADRVDRQIERANLPEENNLSIPLGDLAEEIFSNILWAVPNLHLERILHRATEPVTEEEEA